MLNISPFCLSLPLSFSFKFFLSYFIFLPDASIPINTVFIIYLYLFLSFSAFLFLLYQPVTHSLGLVIPSDADDFYFSEELSFYLIDILVILLPAGNQTPTWILHFAVDFLIGI